MRKAKVLFEYEAAESDELTLRIGDIITEVEDADKGWCSGLLNGKRGMFPDNFVEMIEEEKKVPSPPAAGRKPSKESVRRMKINFAYEADNPDELSLNIGDIIEIIKDIEEGWAEGVKTNGEKGVFPLNFGEMIEGGTEFEEDVRINENQEKQDEEVESSPKKKVKGVGFGNIFSDGPIKLKQRSIGEAEKKNLLPAPSASEEPVEEVSPPKPKRNFHYCRVAFDYTRANDDELSLTKGEIIAVLNKDTGDDGWWEGEKNKNGRLVKGVFPDNFVVELTTDEVRDYENQLQAASTTETSSKDSKVSMSLDKDMMKATQPLPAPPLQSVKLTANDGIFVNDFTEPVFSEPTTTEHTLTHLKRPGGPKNRRRPGAAERREKASASVVLETDREELSNGEAEQKKEPTPKKDSAKRGVAVLPGLGVEGDSPTGEAPSWLQNLKSRQTAKKPPIAPNKEQSPAEKLAWVTGLKKRQSSEFPDKAPTVPVKEKPLLLPKANPENGQAAPPAKPPAPKPVQKPSPPTAKPLTAWKIERKKKAMTAAPNDGKAPDLPAQQDNAASSTDVTPPSWKKNSPPRKAPGPPELRAPAAVNRLDKPTVRTAVPAPVGGARVKPPPPKKKPAPAVKPASSAAVDELRKVLKNMKGELHKIKDEMKKDVQKLSHELQNERNLRMSLEDEIQNLRQEIL